MVKELSPRQMQKTTAFKEGRGRGGPEKIENA